MYFFQQACRRSKEKGEKLRPSKQSSVSLYLRRKSFLKPPGGFLCISITTVRYCGHSGLLTRPGRRALAKGIILYHVVIPSSPTPWKRGCTRMRGGGVGLSEPDNTQSEPYKVKMDLLTQGWELRSMKQDDGFRTNYVQSSRTSPNTTPFFTASLCKVAWKTPPSGHLHSACSSWYTCASPPH